MKKVVYFAIAALLLTSFASAGEARNDHGRGKKDSRVERVEASGTNVAVNVVFLPREVRVIREYYGTQFRSLPPGLQKKYRRTGQLPPGWRKKMQPFPVAVERQLEVLPVGYGRGVIDGHAVIYNPRTQVIVDIAVLF
jgi:hypothetical protein